MHNRTNYYRSTSFRVSPFSHNTTQLPVLVTRRFVREYRTDCWVALFSPVPLLHFTIRLLCHHLHTNFITRLPCEIQVNRRVSVLIFANTILTQTDRQSGNARQHPQKVNIKILRSAIALNCIIPGNKRLWRTKCQITLNCRESNDDTAQIRNKRPTAILVSMLWGHLFWLSISSLWTQFSNW